MLGRDRIWEIACEQLALDYSCREEDLMKPGIQVMERELKEGRRLYSHDGCLLKILCLNRGALVSTGKEMAAWSVENLAKEESSWLLNILC